MRPFILHGLTIPELFNNLDLLGKLTERQGRKISGLRVTMAAGLRHGCSCVFIYCLPQRQLKILKGKHMSSLIPGSYFIQDVMQICAWIAFFGLAVAAHTAQSEEGSFAIEKDTSTTKPANSDTHWQPAYRLDTNVALKRPKDAVPSGDGFSSAPRLFLFAEPKKEDGWSINIQKQTPSSSTDCSPLSSLLCLESKDERPDIKHQQDSFWFVLRKAFHF